LEVLDLAAVPVLALDASHVHAQQTCMYYHVCQGKIDRVVCLGISRSGRVLSAGSPHRCSGQDPGNAVCMPKTVESGPLQVVDGAFPCYPVALGLRASMMPTGNGAQTRAEARGGARRRAVASAGPAGSRSVTERRTTRAVLDEIRAGVTAHPALEGLLHLDWLEAVPIDGLPDQ